MRDQDSGAVSDGEVAVPLEQVLPRYAAATAARRAGRCGARGLGARRVARAALNSAVMAHEEAWAAEVRAEAGSERDAARGRLADTQLMLATAYSAASVYYRAGSPTRTAMVDAASYLRQAVDAHEAAGLARAVEEFLRDVVVDREPLPVLVTKLRRALTGDSAVAGTAVAR